MPDNVNSYSDSEDKDILGGTKLGVTVIIPESYFHSMTYDTFLVYANTIKEEVARQVKDAAVDEWFKAQPLYNGDKEKPNPDNPNVERGYN
jgi:hypothetical protein